MMEKLTVRQALQNIDMVCAVFKGTREEHVVLQQSLQLIEAELKPKPEKDNGETNRNS